MKHAIIIGTLSLVFSSCLKDELPVPERPRGDAMTVQTCMGAGYQEQLWLDVRTGAVVSTNVKTAWDLALQSSPDGWRIYLNGSKLMTAWNVGTGDITQPHDTVGMAVGKRIDAPSGHRDSTAIGDWRGTDAIFIIDLGVNALGQPQGVRKIRFLGVNASEFTFETAALDGSQFAVVTVPKDASRSFTCYKDGTGVVPIEPPQGQWDLVVTQYTHQFYEPFLPYIVTGVLSAPTTRVALVHDIAMGSVTLDDTLHFPFSSARDAIGYKWKYYSFETGSYTVDPSLVYIVEDEEGYFYKLRFIDFYSDQGEVGCPRFEVQPL